MPHKDPERRRAMKRASARRARERERREEMKRVLAEVESGDGLPLPEPPARDELLRLLGLRARSGSVRAIELLLRNASTEPAGDGQLDRLDARARSRRPGARRFS